MIDHSMRFIQQTANDYINQYLPNVLGQEKVIMTTFVNDGGQTQIPAESVGLSLLNIEQERTFRARAMGQLESTDTSTPVTATFVHRPVDLNLQVMFTSNFSNYEESLRHISFIIQCFQANPNMTLAPLAVNGESIELVMELNALPLEQQYYIWTMVGLRYLPSVVYRLRMIRIQDLDKTRVKQRLRSLDAAENSKEARD